LNKRKKIAIVANTTWNIYNFRMPLLRALEAQGHQVVVIAPLDEHIVYLNQLRHTTHQSIKHLARKGRNPISEIRLLMEFFRIFRKEKPDLVINYTIKPNIYGNWAAVLRGVPSICVVTGLGYTFIHNGIINQISQRLYQFSFRKATKVIFENEDDYALFIKDKICTPEQGIAVKGCGVDTNFFKPQIAKLSKSEQKVFTFIGRLLYDKGVEEFVNAARLVKKEFPEAIFLIAGELDHDNPAAVPEGILSQWIENQHVTYIGHVQDIRPVIEISDLIVLPSYREGMPRVILEALSMGKPVITTETAGCRETVEEGKNGFLVPIKNVPELAETIRVCCRLSPERLLAMGQYSRKKALSEFDEQIIVNRFMEIINDILGVKSRVAI
jgi:glycosyltransferase involved in cell wall biosynthesis